MSSASFLVRDKPPGHLPPVRTQGDDGAALSVWLRRSLSRQYDAVLAEDLPPAMIALARTISGEH